MSALLYNTVYSCTPDTFSNQDLIFRRVARVHEIAREVPAREDTRETILEELVQEGRLEKHPEKKLYRRNLIKKHMRTRNKNGKFPVQITFNGSLLQVIQCRDNDEAKRKLRNLLKHNLPTHVGRLNEPLFIQGYDGVYDRIHISTAKITEDLMPVCPLPEANFP